MIRAAHADVKRAMLADRACDRLLIKTTAMLEENIEQRQNNRPREPARTHMEMDSMLRN
jgi:hypothetical protein